MRRASRTIRVLLAVLAIAVSGGVMGACGAGHGNVYVGVGVVGPYWGYPGYYPPPTMIGRPPVYWEEEEEEEEEEDDADALEDDRADVRAELDRPDGSR